MNALVFALVTVIRNHRASFNVHSITDNCIANKAKVSKFAVRKEKACFYFAGRSDYNTIRKPYATAEVSVVSDETMRTNNARGFEHGLFFNIRVAMNRNAF